MRLLVAGWHGQIAQALVELAAATPSITALSVGRPALDLCTPSTIRSTFVATRPDVMINTAAYTAVDAAESDERAAFDLNCRGAAAFAHLAARHGVPIIHMSTGYVFDGEKDGPYGEDDAPRPQTVYGRSKLAGEAEVVGAIPCHLILRTSWVFSPYGRNFVSHVLDLARERDEIEIVDDQVGSPTSALDLAAAVLDLAARLGGIDAEVPWGTYHIAGGGEASWFTLARKALEFSGALGGPTARVRPISGADYATRAPRLANSRLDTARMSRNFGISLPPWEQSLEVCVRRLLETDAPADNGKTKRSHKARQG
jgi:dTDP-4-dehydrorhamnose reductase